MRKFIAALSLACFGTLLIAAPASATEVNAPCSYGQSGINPVASKLKVTENANGEIVARGELYNDGINRDWDWTFRHNGDMSARGDGKGNFVVSRVMINFTGPDAVKWIVENNAGTVRCEATINWYG